MSSQNVTKGSSLPWESNPRLVCVSATSSSLCAMQMVKSIEQFGVVVEDMLIKHGKKIIGESVCACVCLGDSVFQ